VVISLGGSQIFSNGEINVSYLKKFRDLINKHRRNYNFVIVTGGGSIARIYIEGLRKNGSGNKLQSFAGISVTRTNARFLSYFFGRDVLEGIPHKISDVQRLAGKKDIVFCGGLEYHANQTSDSTAAQIAEKLNAEFINITNVDGLYNKNPKKSRDAKLISFISWKKFNEIASKIMFKPGQHFVLDQRASKIIMDKKIKTYIVGPKIKELDELLKGKSFRGTVIYR